VQVLLKDIFFEEMTEGEFGQELATIASDCAFVLKGSGQAPHHPKLFKRRSAALYAWSPEG
jgi:hypothetical protein